MILPNIWKVIKHVPNLQAVFRCSINIMYPLVICYIAIENGPFMLVYIRFTRYCLPAIQVTRSIYQVYLFNCIHICQKSRPPFHIGPSSQTIGVPLTSEWWTIPPRLYTTVTLQQSFVSPQLIGELWLYHITTMVNYA